MITQYRIQLGAGSIFKFILNVVSYVPYAHTIARSIISIDSRGKIVILSEEGYTQRHITARIGCSQQDVCKVLVVRFSGKFL